MPWRPKPQSVETISRFGAMTLSARRMSAATSSGGSTCRVRWLTTPMAIFLSAPMPWAKLSISSPPLSAASNVTTSTSSRSKKGQRLGVEASLGLGALGGGIAPAGVAPHLGLVAQALHLGVEGLDQKVAGDLLVVDADHAVDRRLLDLDHRAAGVGE